MIIKYGASSRFDLFKKKKTVCKFVATVLFSKKRENSSNWVNSDRLGAEAIKHPFPFVKEKLKLQILLSYFVSIQNAASHGTKREKKGAVAIAATVKGIITVTFLKWKFL